MNRLIRIDLLQLLAPRVRVARAFAAVLLAGVLTSSCDVHGASGPGDLATLVVAPSPQTLVVNGTQQFIATGRDFSGATVGVSPEWTVVAGGGAITSSGTEPARDVPAGHRTGSPAVIHRTR